MKRLIIISFVLYTLLGFGLGSFPFRNVDKSEGSLTVEYGLPFRWLTIHRRIAAEKTRAAAADWWQTEKYSWKLSSLLIDVAIAAFAGSALTMLTVRAATNSRRITMRPT
jgi:hypothetical protein